MKTKIIGILVLMLLLATTVLSVTGTVNVGRNHDMEIPDKPVDLLNLNQEIPKPKPTTQWIIGPLCFLPDCDWNYWTSPPDMYTIPSGKVGIGTTSPDAKLEVKDDSGMLVTASDGDMQLRIKPNSATHSCVIMAYGNVVETGYLRINAFGGGGISLNDEYYGGNVGIGTGIGLEIPHTKLQVEGPIATAYKETVGDYRIADNDSIIVATSIWESTITLGNPAGIAGRQYTIKNIGTGMGLVTIETYAGSIDGMPRAYLSPNTPGEVAPYVTVVSDGCSNWLIISHHKLIF